MVQSSLTHEQVHNLVLLRVLPNILVLALRPHPLQALPVKLGVLLLQVLVQHQRQEWPALVPHEALIHATSLTLLQFRKLQAHCQDDNSAALTSQRCQNAQPLILRQ